MLSLEKVIKGFEYCYCAKAETINCPGDCPYYAYDNCEKQVVLDVLELLKKQEHAEPEFGTDAGRPVYKCGACGSVIYCISQYSPAEGAKDHAKFCHNCGRAVKWSD